MTEVDDLVALIPPELRPAGERPHLDVSLRGLHEMALEVPEVPDATSRTALGAILSHRHARDVRRLSLARSREAWPRPSDLDFGWVVDALAELRLPATLEWLFVAEPARTTMDGIGHFATRPRTLVTWNKLTRFASGPFPDVEVLDLRDSDVEWTCGANAFPDLETLIVRPRGPQSIGARWAQPIFARPEVVPRLRELRAPENLGDDILALLLASPLVAQLRCLDFTDALTNRGAAVLCESASMLDGVEELWVATTPERRRQWERMCIGPRKISPPARGELEITEDWRERLRQRFGHRARFDVRPRHPSL